jgi:hypothetical protein
MYQKKALGVHERRVLRSAGIAEICVFLVNQRQNVDADEYIFD